MVDESDDIWWHMMTSGIPTYIPTDWISVYLYRFLMVSWWFPDGFLMVSWWFPDGFLSHAQVDISIPWTMALSFLGWKSEREDAQTRFWTRMMKNFKHSWLENYLKQGLPSQLRCDFCHRVRIQHEISMWGLQWPYAPIELGKLGSGLLWQLGSTGLSSKGGEITLYLTIYNYIIIGIIVYYCTYIYIYIYIYIYAQRLGFAQALQRRGFPFTNKWCCKLP